METQIIIPENQDLSNTAWVTTAKRLPSCRRVTDAGEYGVVTAA